MNDKRTQKNIRRRRGAGIEMAMILMLVVVAFSALLTSTVLMQTQKVKRSTEQLEQLHRRVSLDQIGRDFCEQRGNYVLPDGVTGSIEYAYPDAAAECPGCCIGCEECDAKYSPKPPETEEDTGGNGGTATIEDAGNSGSGENTGDSAPPEGSKPIDDRTETACCKDCECTAGCTQYTQISLVVCDENNNPVLTVTLDNNYDGTYTVAEWSYGG